MRAPSGLGPAFKFALLSLAPIVLLGIALGIHLGSRIDSTALSNARALAEVSARLGLQPHVTPQSLAAGVPPADIGRLDQALEAERLGDRVVALKVWNRQGRVVYSDDRRLVGMRFSISDNLDAALHGRTASEVSSLTATEQRDDRRFGRLLEVYVPISFGERQPPSGAFELYLPYAPIAAQIAAQTRDLALYLGAGLALLWAFVLRIAVSTSRRLRRQAAQLREQAERSRHQATHDTLTDLPNRTLFGDRCDQAIRSARRRGERVGVLLIDVDRFKEVNDALGHRIGDLLLREVGARLEGALRASDTVARFGGDEFAVLLPDLAEPAAALDVAESLRVALSEGFSLEGVALHVEASTGVALYPDHGHDVATLLQRADVAMYLANGSGRGSVLYEPERDVNSVDRLTLLGELRGALERDELELYYQPKVDPATGVIEGVEALLRWNHTARGVLPPAEFIPLAEQTDLMPALTGWVLRTGLAQAADWRERGLDLALAINLSATGLVDHRLVAHVAAELERTGVPAERLTVEVTESAVMTDPLRARELLHALSRVGVNVAIDDFGTGHSSLAYLNRLPVDELKIDRAFVGGMSDDLANAAIVRSTIELAGRLGLRVVAEGVEEQSTLEALRDCDLVQGFAVSRPLPAAKLDIWIAESERCGVYTPERCALAAA